MWDTLMKGKMLEGDKKKVLDGSDIGRFRTKETKHRRLILNPQKGSYEKQWEREVDQNARSLLIGERSGKKTLAQGKQVIVSRRSARTGYWVA